MSGVAIIDYGMGNLASVEKACAFLGVRAQVTSDPKQIGRAAKVILPGVGAFGAAMGELKKRRLIAPILDAITEERPFFGLCLGLQLLFESSDEAPGVRGLCILPGKVKRFPRKKGLKVPHMGWNQLEIARRNPLLAGIPDGAFMYFVHSFYAVPGDRYLVAARTGYGRMFPSVVWDGGRIWATQFHPEKSQKWGLRILKNFLSIQETRC
ncbi:MAG: imidazole glycerol phosphate synthase subunit HisH [Candidatus Omnitrophota bacterium]|nr:imidazole glycerol phosphate synthase subunit HisH [Candidatus Omnitrophota bacterium]